MNIKIQSLWNKKVPKSYQALFQKNLNPLESNFPFLKLLEEKEDLHNVHKMKTFFQEKSHILILGTGGSSLGGQTLKAIFGFNTDQELHFLDNVDSQTLHLLFEKISGKNAGYIIISKSGETLETLATFIAILSQNPQILKEGIVITDPKSSSLRTFAQQNHLPILDHPSYLGGRYSILSCVGMLPAALMGCNIEAFREGAIFWVQKLENDPYHESSPLLWALWHVMHHEKGYSNTVFLPYSDCLRSFALWHAQLWGESLGKQNKGLTPIPALGTVDQHSQLQLYLEGPKDKTITFLTHERKTDLTFDASYLPEKFAYLKGKTLNDVMDAEALATFEVVQNNAIPSRHIHLETLDEKTMGALFVHFMLETVFVASMLNINPFDQPAVEASKIRTKEILEKP
jgi:glucose-6-phosphate isomerase